MHLEETHCVIITRPSIPSVPFWTTPYWWTCGHHIHPVSAVFPRKWFNLVEDHVSVSVVESSCFELSYFCNVRGLHFTKCLLTSSNFSLVLVIMIRTLLSLCHIVKKDLLKWLMLCFFICLVKDKTFPSFIKSSNIKVMSKIGQLTSRFGFSTSGQQRLLYACWKPPQINIFEAFLGSSVDRIPTSYPATALKSGKFRCLIKTWITTTTKPSRKGLLDALFYGIWRADRVTKQHHHPQSCWDGKVCQSIVLQGSVRYVIYSADRLLSELVL